MWVSGARAVGPSKPGKPTHRGSGEPSGPATERANVCHVVRLACVVRFETAGNRNWPSQHRFTELKASTMALPLLGATLCAAGSAVCDSCVAGIRASDAVPFRPVRPRKPNLNCGRIRPHVPGPGAHALELRANRANWWAVVSEATGHLPETAIHLRLPAVSRPSIDTGSNHRSSTNSTGCDAYVYGFAAPLASVIYPTRLESTMPPGGSLQHEPLGCVNLKSSVAIQAQGPATEETGLLESMLVVGAEA